MKNALAVLVVLSIAGAFGAGYWLQRDRLIEAQAEATALRHELSQTQGRLADAEAKARLARLFGQYLALTDAVASGNFGEAQTFSSAFFDQVRDASRTTADASVRTALDAILMRRDTVTAGLARGESSVREVLAPIERELRRALGYPLATPDVAAAPATRP